MALPREEINEVKDETVTLNKKAKVTFKVENKIDGSKAIFISIVHDLSQMILNSPVRKEIKFDNYQEMKNEIKKAVAENINNLTVTLSNSTVPQKVDWQEVSQIVILTDVNLGFGSQEVFPPFLFNHELVNSVKEQIKAGNNIEKGVEQETKEEIKEEVKTDFSLDVVDFKLYLFSGNTSIIAAAKNYAEKKRVHAKETGAEPLNLDYINYTTKPVPIVEIKSTLKISTIAVKSSSADNLSQKKSVVEAPLGKASSFEDKSSKPLEENILEKPPKGLLGSTSIFTEPRQESKKGGPSEPKKPKTGNGDYTDEKKGPTV